MMYCMMYLFARRFWHTSSNGVQRGPTIHCTSNRHQSGNNEAFFFVWAPPKISFSFVRVES